MNDIQKLLEAELTLQRCTIRTLAIRYHSRLGIALNPESTVHMMRGWYQGKHYPNRRHRDRLHYLFGALLTR